MSAFRVGLLELTRRTDVLGGTRDPDDATTVRIDTADPQQVLRHVLSGYVPPEDMDQAMDWCVEMANQIISHVAEIRDPDAQKAAATIAVAQTLGIGAATQRAAEGKAR
jgi:hypothetical protein